VARPAPSVERTVALLKMLAAHPRDRFSLSDIARRLNANKATCHAMLSELVEQGMLIRHPGDKTYLLGPALVALGTSAAREAHEALGLARDEMAAIGGEMVIMGRADVDRPLFGYLPVGNRSPLVPPYGAEFLAWAPEAEVEAWLDLHEPALSEAERDAYYQALDRIRLAGYHASELEHVMALRRVVELLSGLPGAARLEAALQELANRPAHEALSCRDRDRIAAVRAPVFGPGGQVVLTLSIGGIWPGMEGRFLGRYADRLLEGTRRITERLGGSEPFPNWARQVESGGRLRHQRGLDPLPPGGHGPAWARRRTARVPRSRPAPEPGASGVAVSPGAS
jgi:DNA-binding IclR family transcriptional regulator